MAQPASPDRLSLDGREFVLIRSTASDVDPARPVQFSYHQHEAMVWGEYAGGEVQLGRFIGERDGARLGIAFAHLRTDGVVTRGRATSVIGLDPDGAVRLEESFTGPDGVQHLSVCLEQPRGPRD